MAWYRPIEICRIAWPAALMPLITRTGLVLVCVLACFGCSGERSDSSGEGSAAVHLKPRLTPLPEPTVRRTVYVPVYSSIYLGLDIRKDIIDLTATVSIRNVSAQYPVILNFVRYYDSGGRLVREYLKEPAELGPLATVEYVVQRLDTTGGPGANFLNGTIGRRRTVNRGGDDRPGRQRGHLIHQHRSSNQERATSVTVAHR